MRTLCHILDFARAHQLSRYLGLAFAFCLIPSLSLAQGPPCPPPLTTLTAQDANGTPRQFSCYDPSTGRMTGTPATSLNSIFASDPKYGVKGDGKFSNATTIVSGQPAITTGGSDPAFTSTDVGQQIFCDADPSGLNGVIVLVKSTITSFTSAHVVTASNNATASQATALCLWGTPSQDTALANFWSDVKTSPTQTCGVLPSGIIMVDSSQFTDTSFTRQFGDCLQSGGFTTIVPTPSFNFATCPSATSGCFWHHPTQAAVQQPNSDGIQNIEVWGLGNNLNAFSTTNSIFFFQRATVFNVWAWGWGATSVSLTGMQFLGPDQIFEAVVYNVRIGCSTNNSGANGTVALVASFCGGVGGNNLSVGSGAVVVSGQSQYGPNNSGTGVSVAGTLNSTGDVFLGNSTGFTLTVPGILNISQGQVTAASTGTGILIQTGGTVNSETTSINASGGSAVAILRQGTGVYNDLRGNKIIAGTFPTIVPSCPAVTGAGATGSCAAVAGSTNEKGTLRITVAGAGPAATGTVTMNFAGTYTGGPCNFSYANTGANAWSLTTTTPIVMTTRSATAPVFNWNQTGALTAGTYDVDYVCS